MQISVRLQDVRLRVEHVVKELCEEQGSALILLLRLVELTLKVLMLIEQRVVLLLLDNQVLFLLFELLLHEVYEVIVATTAHINLTSGSPGVLKVKRSDLTMLADTRSLRV